MCSHHDFLLYLLFQSQYICIAAVSEAGSFLGEWRKGQSVKNGR